MKCSILFPAACVFIGMMLLSSCANILPPMGGYRDSLPPRLVSSIPRDSAVNVTTQNITLTFDEYVTVQNAQQALIVSPNPRNQPLVDSKLRVVTIKMRDSLEKNTTYSLDFGDAIKDVNEGNTAKNFTYAFSTGSKIDNYTYSGKVLLAETGKTDSTLIVVLHRDLSDTAIFKGRPRYYTRLNGKGEFSFKHLPAGTFNVYALMPSFQNNYFDSTTLFAFKSGPLETGTATRRDTLYAYAPTVKKLAPTQSGQALKLPAGSKEDKRLRYAVNFDNGQQDLLNNTTFTFNRKLGSFDSTKLKLYDTNYNQLRGYTLTLDSTRTIVTLKYPWKENTPLRLVLDKEVATDSAGTMLSKADTLKFNTKKESEYGSVRLRFGNLDLSRNPVLQIIRSDKIIESVPLTEAEFRRKLFYPGNFDLRILYDKNRNGIWDPGSFLEKRQPEIVYLVPKQIGIKANWDNEVNIGL